MKSRRVKEKILRTINIKDSSKVYLKLQLLIPYQHLIIGIQSIYFNLAAASSALAAARLARIPA